MKAFKLLFLALVLLVGTTAYGDNATIDGINYIIDTESAYAEVGINTGISGDVVIPTAVDYYMVYDVKRIADYAFIGNPGLTSIDIPSCVISLGEECLANCNNLTDITVHWTDLSGITTHNTAFYGLQSSAVTLHVPYGMETTYANTVPWGVFVNIVEYNPQGQCGDNLYWEYDPSTTILTISGAGNMSDYTDVYYLAPWHGTDITGIVIEDGVTSIGQYAFYNCNSLQSVTIPVGVTSIGNFAFSDCTNLASVTLPEGVTSIGYNAFYFCTGLETVTIPASVETIGNSAFMSCYGLKDVYVYRDSPLSVPPSNIFNNVNLLNVTLHVPYGKSANYTDAPWSNFKTIVEMNPGGQCGPNLTWEYDLAGTLTITGTGAMYDYDYVHNPKAPWDNYKDDITSIILPVGLEHIGEYAFYGCNNVELINIPASVTNIGKYAFYNCSSLGTVAFADGSQLTTIGNAAFFGCAFATIDIPAGVTSIGNSAFSNCTALTSITIPAGVTSIGISVFHYCTNLTSITIPAGVTSIGQLAFYYCTALTSITIPANVTSIGGEAFGGCDHLTDVTVSWTDLSGVSTNADAFEDVTTSDVNLHVPAGSEGDYYTAAPWSSFGAIVVGGSCGANLTWEFNPGTGVLTFFGSGAMTDYEYGYQVPWKDYKANIQTISMPVGLTHIGQWAFANCKNAELTSITIPAGVTGIGDYAFQNCSTLESITFPENMETIGKWAFYKCTGLTSITIPASVTSIGVNPFGTSGLESITVENGNTVYDSRNNCNAIIETATNKLISGCKNTVIPEDVVTIEKCAFEEAGMVYITIPASVTSIATQAFNNCSNLVHMFMLRTSSAPSMALDVFGTSSSAPIPQIHVTTGAFYSCMTTWNSKYLSYVQGDLCGPRLFGKTTSSTKLTIYGYGGEMLDFTNLASRPWNSSAATITTIAFADGNDVTRLGNNAFNGFTAMTSVTIPTSVTSIGEYTFASTGLTDVTVNWTDLSGITTAANAFDGLTLSNVNLHVPAGTYGIYAAADVWKEFNIIDPYGGKCGDNLFWSYDAGTLTISGTGTTMYDYVHYDDVPWFSYAADITSISLPDGLTHIGASAFYGCSNAALTTINIPTGVTSIGYYAFAQCSGLTSLTIPSGVTRIEAGTFCYCSGLTSLTIPSNVTDAIGERAFQGCAALTSIEIPAGVTSIGENAFYNCTNLATVTLNDGLLSIGKSAFEDCSALTSITIPDGVTSIDKYAFSYCTSFESVTIPASVTSLGKGAFYACNTIANMYVSWTDFTGTNIDQGAIYPTYVSYLHLPFGAWGIYNVDPWIYLCFDVVPMVTAKEDPENDGVYYNTFYHSTKKYMLPANVEAYTAKRSGDKMILTKVAEAGQTLPANTAVILKSTIGSYEMYPSDDTPMTVGENDLLGTDVTMDPPANCYVLSGKASDDSETGVGFYEYSAPNQLGAHKAYMVLSSGSGAPKRFRFVFDGEQTTTDIESPSLQGRSGEASKKLRDGQLIIIRNGVEYNANGQMIK